MNTAEAFKLIVDNKKLIISQIRSGACNATKEEIEDLTSQITIELADRLVKDYDPAKGSKVTTYMAMVARSRALDMSRGRKHHAAFDTGSDDSDEGYSYSRELAAVDTGVSSFEAREEIELALGKIDAKLGGRAFAIDCFSGDMETDEIATKYGISPATVFSRRFKLREFLKDQLSR